MTAINPMKSKLLTGLPHGFLGRCGGVSTGLYAGLNVGLGSHDNPAAVIENRRRSVAAVLPGAALITVHQIHSAKVVSVTAPTTNEARPQADALVTDRPGLLLSILTADCVPVLFADHQAGVVGAAHAGWQGALSGVTDATLTAMEAMGADRTRIVTAIGPCISRKSYEVSEAFLRNFEMADRANERFFTGGKPGHHWFDIEAYVTHRLLSGGIARIDVLGVDTYANETQFFSYRRSCHRAEADYGRQISMIGLPG